jgi:hypothetical protein
LAGIDSFAKLVLHCDGVDASTTFTDSSLSPKTVTANNSAQIDTAQSKFGGASGLFSVGTLDYLSVPNNTDWNLGAIGSGNDWTLDFWIRFNTKTTIMGLICPQASAGGNGWQLYWDTSNLALSSDGSTNTVAWNPSTATWYHVAIVKSGTTITAYIDGSSIGTFPDRGMNNDSQNLYIGVQAQPSAGDLYFDGWLDEIRISKGIARWTANFTPPTSAYSANTSSSKMMLMGIG